MKALDTLRDCLKETIAALIGSNRRRLGLLGILAVIVAAFLLVGHQRDLRLAQIEPEAFRIYDAERPAMQRHGARALWATGLTLSSAAGAGFVVSVIKRLRARGSKS